MGARAACDAGCEAGVDDDWIVDDGIGVGVI
jgi:hypothetical protein